MDAGTTLSKNELAALITINFLSNKRAKILGKLRIKKYAKHSNQNLRDKIWEKTGFEQKLGPMMAVSFGDYLKATFLQISNREINYRNEILDEIAIDVLYYILERNNCFSPKKIYDFFSNQITILFDKKGICVDTKIVNELIDELILMYKNTFKQKSFYLKTNVKTCLMFS